MARPGDVVENPAGRMRLRFLRTAVETKGELVEVEATYDPGSVEPLEHFHPRQEEHFEIISGELRARVGGEERTLSAGDELDVPQGTVHAMWNEGDGQARVIWQTRPALRTEDFLVAVGRLAQEGKLTARGARNPLVGSALMHEFRAEFRPTSPPPPVQAIAFPPLAMLARLLGQMP